MEHYLCQDVLNIIFTKIPFDMKSFFITNRYIYNTFLKFKKTLCEGNYILTSIQHQIIQELIHHTTTPQEKSLIIQAQLSVGKTAAILAFCMAHYKQSVVIMVPLSVIPQWYNEILKMYGQDAFKQIVILNDNYCKNNLIQQCRRAYNDPRILGYRIAIVSSLMKTSPAAMMEHSLLIMDEVHTRYYPIIHPKFIGVTASKAVTWINKCHYHVYDNEEELPTLLTHHIILNDNLNITIKDISQKVKGPYLIICHQYDKRKLNIQFICYDRQHDTLVKMNNMNADEYAVLEPGNNSAGINLTNIGCVIYIYPAERLNETVIQSLGRVRRVTSKNKNITVYNIHEHQHDIYLYKTYLDENEIINYCKQHQLILNKHLRDKYYFKKCIDTLLKLSTCERLDQVPAIDYALMLRLSKKNFNYLYDSLSKVLNLDYNDIVNILN